MRIPVSVAIRLTAVNEARLAINAKFTEGNFCSLVKDERQKRERKILRKVGR